MNSAPSGPPLKPSSREDSRTPPRAPSLPPSPSEAWRGRISNLFLAQIFQCLWTVSDYTCVLSEEPTLRPIHKSLYLICNPAQEVLLSLLFTGGNQVHRVKAICSKPHQGLTLEQCLYAHYQRPPGSDVSLEVATKIRVAPACYFHSPNCVPKMSPTWAWHLKF